TRTAITLQGPDGPSETTRAIVALGMEGFRAGILAVGDDEPSLARKLSAAGPKPRHKWLARQILNAVETRMPSSEAASAPALRFLRPGEDPFWDAKWQNWKELPQSDLKRAENPREIFLVEPLARETWAPHLIHGALMFVLWTSEFTSTKLAPAFRRPKLELHAASDLSELEYAELVDQLHSLWGKRRIQLLPGHEVSPRPLTPLVIGYIASRVFVWLALLVALYFTQRGDVPSSAALIAASLAGAAVLIGRRIKGRAVYELPRRTSAERSSPLAASK
ncbi:MAG TPA: hypothetical protein VK524_12070, partial [Polyangiaceae bacterium]|nr:hypothetical protein [Polyangiaceae bacterium]